ncbi:MAG TPA: hypothetical protein VFV33_12600, partial [Gemmatimonadaceae bacterium]|nr:hypothetical protein [Gemmatimonadaceae bacterium]
MRLVLVVPPGWDSGGDPEARAAVAWTRAGGWRHDIASLERDPPPSLAADDVVWCHAGGDVPALTPAWREAMVPWIAGGGRVLLSALATPLARALGAPDETPQVQRFAPWRHEDDPLWDAGFRDWPDYPHIRGAQGWGPHPLFDALQRGTYTWRATEGETVARTVFLAPHWPRGRVLAVDRAYVRLDAETAVAWEYDVGRGRILCLGANVVLTARDESLAPQRDRYLANAIAALDPDRPATPVERTAWPVRDVPVRDVPGRDASASAVCRVAEAPPLPSAGALPADGLRMSGEARADAPFTIAGRRTLVVGDEATGSREWWIHPLCVLSEGLRLTVDGAPLRATSVTVTPGAVERALVDHAGRRWRELIATAPEHALVQYEAAAVEPA